MSGQLSMFANSHGWVDVRDVNRVLHEHHYLGSVQWGYAWQDEAGVVVLANPRSRRLPASWLEITRWCIRSAEPYAATRQWSRLLRGVRLRWPKCTTIVSYSDPSVGHSGGIYRACSWWWAPTWLRLRPPPSGHGSWSEGGKRETPKDRWVFALRRDATRVRALGIDDAAILRRWPDAAYREPGGVPLALRDALLGKVGAP